MQNLVKSAVARAEGYFASDRVRGWLISPYEDDEWIVEDSAGEKEQETLSFKVRMADGRMLREHSELCETAKELVFWIRDSPYTDIDSAKRHSAYADVMVRLCFGLTARGFKSFADLNPIDIERICEDAAKGIDGLTGASKMLRNALSMYPAWDVVPPSLLKKSGFNLHKVIDQLHLPERWARKEIKLELEAIAERLATGVNGLSVEEIDIEVAEDDDDEAENDNDTKVSMQQIQVLTSIFDALFHCDTSSKLLQSSLNRFQKVRLRGRRNWAAARGQHRLLIPTSFSNSSRGLSLP
ncbi:hypothetical protein LZK77_16415 [Rhizobium leguminosarum]|nr:hypothetical protein LZK77_16415 [Rhizobium leguminosarum]